MLDCFSNWVELEYNKEVLASLPEHFLLNAALTFISDTSISS